MADDEKTRRFGGSADIERTRLVRRSSPSTADSEDTIKIGGEPKTRMAFRPNHTPSQGSSAPQKDDEANRLVTGWLVVVGGPGRGKFTAVYDGMNSIGRGADQAAQLNFGDESISRSEHAFVTYDYKDRKFYLHHGSKANIVRLNDQPVLQPTELHSGDTVFIGSTTLKFVAMCGAGFDWTDVGV
jgi:hypothetical protein